MVQGLLKLIGGYPLLFKKELANPNRHDNGGSRLPALTESINSDLKRHSQGESPALLDGVVTPRQLSVDERPLYEWRRWRRR